MDRGSAICERVRKKIVEYFKNNVPQRQRLLTLAVQKPASLMVWGCISAYGMGSLHVLEGTMNAERYIKVLEQHMLPSRGRVFQQDNAKPHTAAITTAWLRSRRVRC